ncbi:MAG: cell division protein FtsL [Lactobacillus iners]|nr:cell division protein FtsL [Lactobacillus iners]MCT7867774.1 cell division protein FtsL [Lactobacillus iners]
MVDSSARNFRYSELDADNQRNKQVIVRLTSPNEPLSLTEVLFIAFGVVMTLIMMCFMISSNISATNAQRNLSEIQKDIATVQNKNTNLRQEIGELTSANRMNKLAKQYGLQLIESNIRNIR